MKELLVFIAFGFPRGIIRNFFLSIYYGQKESKEEKREISKRDEHCRHRCPMKDECTDDTPVEVCDEHFERWMMIKRIERIARK